MPVTTQWAESLDLSSWTKLAPNGSGFSVYLPEVTEEQKPTVSVGNGQVGLTQYVFSKDVEGAYVVMYSDVRADRTVGNEVMFRAARDRVVGTLGGRLMNESAVQTGDTTGREVQVQTRDGALVRQQMFVFENRFYQVIAAGRPEFVKSSDVQKYFRSFRLTSHVN